MNSQIIAFKRECSRSRSSSSRLGARLAMTPLLLTAVPQAVVGLQRRLPLVPLLLDAQGVLRLRLLLPLLLLFRQWSSGRAHVRVWDKLAKRNKIAR